MFKALAPYESGAIRERIKDLLERSRVLAERGEESDSLKIFKLVEDYENLVLAIGSKQFDGTPLDSRATATFQRLNEIMTGADEDIRALYNEIKGLSQMLARSFNVNQASLRGANAALQRGAALVLTAGLEGAIPQRGMFVAVDTFQDQRLMDLSASTAEVGFGGSALTLQRLSVEQILDVGAQIQVDADSRTLNDILLPTITTSAEGGGGKISPIESLPPYEGKLYSEPIDEMRPEAGRLKFVNNNKSLSETPPEELVLARRVMLDSNADTYWQVERVILTDFKNVEPGDLDSNLKYDFEVSIVIKLSEPKTVSALTLDPMQFGSRAYMEIRNIETSLDGQMWESIPGLHDYNFYNILTDEANKQLTPALTNAVMAPSKYSYEGRGLWIFPTRELRYVRLRIVQRTPIAAPYEVLILKQQQTVKTTKKGFSILGFGGKSRTKTKTEYRNLELSYVESLAVVFGSKDGSALDTGASVKAKSGMNVDIPGLGNIFSSGSKTTSKSGFNLQSIETASRTNAVRYVIGIRDFGLLSAVYDTESQYVSKNFDIPSPVRQIQLRAAHTIPDEFGSGDWIRYLVSVDDGVTWDELAPIEDVPKYTGGTRIPTTLLVNSGTPEDAKDDRFGYRDIGQPADKVKVRIELSRPSNIAGSPVVNRYALQVLTEETFAPVKI